MFDIIGIGELLIDFTPTKINGEIYFKDHSGGAPCNMLTMATKLGSKTAFIGKVGKDQFGFKLKQTLDSVGVNTNGLILSEAYPTTLAFVHLDESGDRSFSFYRNHSADVMLEKQDIDYKMIDQTRAFHFGSLSFTTEPSRSTVLEVLAYAKSKGKLITYDPNYRPALWNNDKEAIEGMKLGLKYADIIKVSDEEALLITGEKTIEAAAEKLYQEGIKLVCVTLGEKGSYYHSMTGQGIVDGYPSKVVDTTGAGDSFFGAVVHTLLATDYENLEEKEIINALKIGNAAASIVIENYGGIPSIPEKETVFSRL